LLPRLLVQTALEPLHVARGSLGIKVLDPSRYEEAVKNLADLFNVNPIVARIRLQDLYLPQREERQVSL
jgi:hypothetical protein